MTIADLIELLQEEDQTREVYKIVNGNEFQLLEPEDLADIELETPTDIDGNELDDEEFPHHVFCINFEDASGEMTETDENQK